MLIGLCGATCSGKHTVAEYLTRSYGCIPLYLSDSDANSDSNRDSDHHEHQQSNGTGKAKRVDTRENSFPSIDALVDFVTKRWQRNYVLERITSESVLEALLKRPFFLLVSIDAPVSLRWKRQQPSQSNADNADFAAFVLRSDAQMYNASSGLAALMSEAAVKIINSTSSTAKLHDAIDRLNLLDESRLRPSWDQYFMQLASLAAQRSNCMKRRVGAVLVREKRVLSTGYNGTPRGLKNCNHGGCSRCNGGQGAGVGLSTCLCLHAEENALLEAGRDRIREGTILYCDTCPCLTCSIKITQVGISEVVYSQGYSMDRETASILQEGGVKLRQFSPPRKGLICLEDSDAQE